MAAMGAVKRNAVGSQSVLSLAGQVMKSFGLSARFGAPLLALSLGAPAARADEGAVAAAEATDEVVKAPEPVEALVAAPAVKVGKVDPLTGVTLGTSGARQFAHVLISRRERAEGRSELSLFGTVQVNGKFTQHVGTGLEFGHHLREAFALTAGGTWYPYAVQSGFTEQELITKASQQPFAASAVLMDWETHAGFELQPIYGKFAVFNSGVVQFGFYLGSSVGVGHTKIQLGAPDEKTGRDRSFGDIGFKPVGVFNAGFRMFFSERLALRAEIRDTVFSSVVDRINGCNAADLKSLAASGKVSDGCNGAAFDGAQRDYDIGVAKDLVGEPSSDIINNVQFTTALSVLF
jgi:outer membrane beta-barrel protein